VTDSGARAAAPLPCAILAGGLATRMGSLTAEVPKALLPVGGRPFVEHQLEWLARGGVREVVLCIGHLGDRLRAHVGDGERLGVRVRYADDGDARLGTGGALREACRQGLLGEAFLVTYGDSYLAIDPRAVATTLLAGDAPAVMSVFRNDDRHDRSNVALDGLKVARYEKGLTNPMQHGMDHIDYGLMAFRRDALLQRLPAAGPADLAPVLTRLARERLLAAVVADRRFYEIGSPAGLRELEELLA